MLLCVLAEPLKHAAQVGPRLDAPGLELQQPVELGQRTLVLTSLAQAGTEFTLQNEVTRLQLESGHESRIALFRVIDAVHQHAGHFQQRTGLVIRVGIRSTEVDQCLHVGFPVRSPAGRSERGGRLTAVAADP